MFRDGDPRLTEAEMKEALYIMAEATVGVELVGSAGIQSRFSGVHIGKGAIMTVHHGISEIEDNTVLTVNVKDRRLNSRTFEALLERIYPGIDIALLRIPGYQFGIQTVSLAENSEIQQGRVLTYVPYYPQRRLRPCRVLDTQVQPEELNPQAIVDYPLLVSHLYKVLLPNYSPLPGNSGCGVFNSKGQLIGITHAGSMAKTEKGTVSPIGYMVATEVIRR